MLRIAIFASGSGTNAENLIKYFNGKDMASVALILTDNPDAGVIGRAERAGIPCSLFSRKQFLNGNDILQCLDEFRIDFLILAGFLLLVPENIINRFDNRIVNIHPALLPAHGGKGFYGSNVHQAVINSGSIISGITIHKVNSKFDEGEIIFQAACHVSRKDNAESLATKIHALEYSYFPVVIEKYLESINTQII